MHSDTSVLVLCIFACVLMQLDGQTLPPVVRVGGLFEFSTPEAEVLRFIVDRLTKDGSLVTKSTLQSLTQPLKPHDSFQASKSACNLLSHGVLALFGPKEPAVISILRSTAKLFNVPHILTNPVSEMHQQIYEESDNSSAPSFTLSLYPDTKLLNKAYLDLFKSKKTRSWKSLTIIYQHDDMFTRLRHLITESFNARVRVNFHEYSPDVALVTQLKEIRLTKEINFVLDLDHHLIVKVLKAANDLNMMTEYHTYLITSLDLHTLDLRAIYETSANITAFQLVDLNRKEIRSIEDDWRRHRLREGERKHLVFNTNMALIVDGVLLFVKAINDIAYSNNFQSQSFSCEEPMVWTSGKLVTNRMKLSTIRGMTGVIRLDENGKRTDLSLNIIEMKSDGLKKVGTWSSRQGIQYSLNYSRESTEELIKHLASRELRVTTIINPPYTMLKADASARYGNDRFEGFCIDLMEELAKMIGFQYRLQLVKDNKYGSRDPKTGEWNGMIRELIEYEADAAIVDLTITYVREEAVDFTMPFMNTGISILFRKPAKANPPLFLFMEPFSPVVWWYMLTAFLGTSLTYYVLARFSPYENRQSFQENPDLDIIENEFTISNRIWFATGSIMQQGSDLNPCTPSTRSIASIWWFFTLIIVSSYTANLAAFFTAQRLTNPIDNAQDLAKQTKIAYGCLQSGSTKSFFEESQNPLYKRMWATMQSSRPTVFAPSNEKGIERVLRGGYAYLMESTTIEYLIERNCHLTKIGGLLDNKGYGIATPPGSPIRDVLSAAIVRLNEGDTLLRLKTKWWKSAQKCSGGGGGSSELGMSQLGGVFVVLLSGCALGLIIVTGEFLWNVFSKLPNERKPLLIEFLIAAKLVISCKHQIPAPRSSTSSSVSLASRRPLPNVGTSTAFTENAIRAR